VSGDPDLSRPAVAGLAEQRRKLGEDLRELATQRYAMAKEGLNPLDATSFAKWLAEKRAEIESKGQKASWIELVQKLLPNEAAMARDYDTLSERIRQSSPAATK
jgi:hypothetical protein